MATLQPRIVGGVESSENDWPYMVALMHKDLKVTVNNEKFSAIFMAQSSAKVLTGKLVDCGNAFYVCEGVEGHICLISRGKTTFSKKVSNCEAGGGIGAIVYNNVEGIFFGDLGFDGPNIPVVSISQAAGAILLTHLDEEVRFDYSSSGFCGATYIGGKWLVTAAHCVNDIYKGAFFANVGGHNTEKDKSHVLDIAQIIVHVNYDAKGLGNDIALVELVEEPIGVKPVLLASESILNLAITNEAPVIALGRGVQEALSPSEDPALTPGPTQLFEVEINLFSNATCNAGISNYYRSVGGSIVELVKDDMLCAGTQQGNVGTCFGDSGGPLILQQDGQDYLVGVTSWGLGCAVPGLYDTFSRAPYFKSDIERVTSGEINILENFSVNEKPNVVVKTQETDDTFFLSTNRELLLLFVILLMCRFHSRLAFTLIGSLK